MNFGELTHQPFSPLRAMTATCFVMTSYVQRSRAGDNGA